MRATDPRRPKPLSRKAVTAKPLPAGALASGGCAAPTAARSALPETTTPRRPTVVDALAQLLGELLIRLALALLHDLLVLAAVVAVVVAVAKIPTVRRLPLVGTVLADVDRAVRSTSGRRSHENTDQFNRRKPMTDAQDRRATAAARAAATQNLTAGYTADPDYRTLERRAATPTGPRTTPRSRDSRNSTPPVC